MDFESLRDELTRLFRDIIRFDDVSRAIYSTDSSLFSIKPLGVAVPRTEEELSNLVKYAHEHQLPIIPRGAGTGLSGEALGEALIIDLSVHFRSILEIHEESVRVQPGVVYRNLNQQLSRIGRRLAVDPASGSTCTIGGMLATNASGSKAIRYGYFVDHVQSLRTIWDTGEIDFLSEGPTSFTPRGLSIEKSLKDLLDSNREILYPTNLRTKFNRCGYRLHDIQRNPSFHWPRILVGSEGTLGVFSEATIKTIPLPASRSAALFVFSQLETALRASAFARQSNPVACELMDRRLVSIARAYSEELSKLVPASSEAVLLVEWEADNSSEAKEHALGLIETIYRKQGLAQIAIPAFDDISINQLWQIRESSMPSLYALGRGPRPVAFIEDIGIPPDDLPEFIGKLQTILRKFGVTASFMIHAATGQIHTRPFLDLEKTEDRGKLWAIADEVHSFVIESGGTISTQHGTGIARTPWIEKQFGKLAPLYREVKKIFDPRNILNPGKIVSLDPSRPSWPLKFLKTEWKNGSNVSSSSKELSKSGIQSPPSSSSKELSKSAIQSPSSTSSKEISKSGIQSFPQPDYKLQWKEGEFVGQVSACNNCGDCRTEESTQRMCPIFRVLHEEAASPRAKANLLHEVLNQPKADRIGDQDIREVADLCVNCKMCSRECHANVNIPKLMLEAKTANYLANGFPRGNWFLARIERIATWGSTVPIISNALLSTRTVRWFMERLFGLSRKRRLPAFARRNFLKIARRKGWTQKSHRVSPTSQQNPSSPVEKVALFLDSFAIYHDPSIAEAAVHILHHLGIEVYVPEKQVGCGMAALSQGDAETAREMVWKNLRIFGELIREGYKIVCTEPTAAVMFREDMLNLIEDPDAQAIAENTVEMTAYLWDLHLQGRLKTDFLPVALNLGHHVPCHIKALGRGIHGPKLLSLIPEIRVDTIDKSCSGMAGTYGFLAKNYVRSLEAGQEMIGELSRPGYAFGSTECSACRMQMEEGTGKRTLHPIQYLALAYGLMPEMEQKLKQPLRDWISS